MKKFIFIVVLIVSLGGISWYIYQREFLLSTSGALIVIQFFC